MKKADIEARAAQGERYLALTEAQQRAISEAKDRARHQQVFDGDPEHPYKDYRPEDAYTSDLHNAKAAVFRLEKWHRDKARRAVRKVELAQERKEAAERLERIRVWRRDALPILDAAGILVQGSGRSNPNAPIWIHDSWKMNDAFIAAGRPDLCERSAA